MPTKSDRHDSPPELQCSHCGTDAGLRTSAGDGVRCECGSLLARYVAGRLELKCRRCKRIATVPLDGATEADSTG